LGRTLDLCIVIVNFNVRDLLKDCLDSLFYGHEGLSLEVIVVDNNSRDDSVAMVRQNYPKVSLIESSINGGYAYANNLALDQIAGRDLGSMPRYVLLLNPDTVVPPGALSKMVSFMDAHPEAGAAGPKLIRPNGSLDLACRRSFPSPEVSFFRLSGLSKAFPRHPRFGRYNLTFLSPEDVYEVDSVVGAFMMVRSSVLLQVGPLDEQFFMYGEDLDWAFRIKKLGWKVLYNGQVEVFHHKGESSRQRSTRSIVEFYRAMLVF
jgi:GT2 family glycosyltransferase